MNSTSVGDDAEGREEAAVPDDRDTGRPLTLSDGVFAIAITLLTFQLQVTKPLEDSSSWSQLASAISDIEPKLETYAITFLVLGAYWMGHHRLFRRIVRYDRRLLLLNLLYLLGVAFTPFPASLMGTYPRNPLAVVIYAGNLAWLSALSGITGVHAQSAGLSVGTRAAYLTGQWRAWSSMLIFLLSMPITIVSARAAQLFWLLLWPVLVFVTRKANARRPA
jgi:uncharacterized membrane protein